METTKGRLMASDMAKIAQDKVKSEQRRKEYRQREEDAYRKKVISVIKADPAGYIEDNYAAEIRRRAADGKTDVTLYEHRDWPELIEIIVGHLTECGFTAEANRRYEEPGTDINSGLWRDGYFYYQISVRWGGGER